MYSNSYSLMFVLVSQLYNSALYKYNFKYMHSVSFLQLPPPEKTEVMNLGRAATEFVISRSLSSRIQTYARKFNPAVYAKLIDWLC
jgi:hypothetical protein